MGDDFWSNPPDFWKREPKGEPMKDYIDKTKFLEVLDQFAKEAPDLFWNWVSVLAPKSEYVGGELVLYTGVAEEHEEES